MSNRKYHLIVAFNPYEFQNGDSARFFSWVEYFKISKKDLQIHLVVKKLNDPRSQSKQSDSQDNSFIHQYSSAFSNSSIIKKVQLHKFAILHGCPPWIASSYSRQLDLAVRGIDFNKDVTIFFGEAAGIYIPKEKIPNSYWDKCNVITFSTLSERRESRTLFQKIRFSYHHVLAKRFESKAVQSPTTVIATSEREITNLQRIFSNRKYVLIKTVGHAYRPITPNPLSTTIGWLGNFSYGPNWRGLSTFLEETSGYLRDEGYTLRVIGANCRPEQQNALKAFECVQFVGFAKDLSNAFNGCKALVVPIWSGAGIKLMTLEGLALGLPIICTPEAIEGIPEEAALGISSKSTDLARIAVESREDTLLKNLSSAKKIYLENFTQFKFNTEVDLLLLDSDHAN